MRRAVALAAIVLMLAGCGIRPTGILSAGTPPQADHEHGRNTIYLLRKGRLVRVERAGVDGDAVLPFDQLGRGPTAAERRSGITTEVPGDLVIFSYGMHLLSFSGRRPLTRAARAQIACTAADVRGTETLRVRFQRRTFSCEDFRDLR
jgi:hypothetical protein